LDLNYTFGTKKNQKLKFVSARFISFSRNMFMVMIKLNFYEHNLILPF